MWGIIYLPRYNTPDREPVQVLQVCPVNAELAGLLMTMPHQNETQQAYLVRQLAILRDSDYLDALSYLIDCYGSEHTAYLQNNTSELDTTIRAELQTAARILFPTTAQFVEFIQARNASNFSHIIYSCHVFNINHIDPAELQRHIDHLRNSEINHVPLCRAWMRQNSEIFAAQIHTHTEEMKQDAADLLREITLLLDPISAKGSTKHFSLSWLVESLSILNEIMQYIPPAQLADMAVLKSSGSGIGHVTFAVLLERMLSCMISEQREQNAALLVVANLFFQRHTTHPLYASLPRLQYQDLEGLINFNQGILSNIDAPYGQQLNENVKRWGQYIRNVQRGKRTLTPSQSLADFKGMVEEKEFNPHLFMRSAFFGQTYSRALNITPMAMIEYARRRMVPNEFYVAYVALLLNRGGFHPFLTYQIWFSHMLERELVNTMTSMPLDLVRLIASYDVSSSSNTNHSSRELTFFRSIFQTGQLPEELQDKKDDKAAPAAKRQKRG
jgi:hypothetical protein